MAAVQPETWDSSAGVEGRQGAVKASGEVLLRRTDGQDSLLAAEKTWRVGRDARTGRRIYSLAVDGSRLTVRSSGLRSTPLLPPHVRHRAFRPPPLPACRPTSRAPAAPPVIRGRDPRGDDRPSSVGNGRVARGRIGLELPSTVAPMQFRFASSTAATWAVPATADRSLHRPASTEPVQRPPHSAPRRAAARQRGSDRLRQ